MDSTKRVAMVTGANQGLGFATVRALCKQFDGDVYLTARNEERGKEAVKELQKEGLDPKFHQLDTTSMESIDRIKKHFLEHYGGIDVLVDNAGIAYKIKSTVPFGEQATNTIANNFYGRYNVYMTLFPIVKPHGRIVEVGGRSGARILNEIHPDLAARFRSPDITEEKLVELSDEFVRDAKEGKHLERGWNTTAYSFVKTCILLMTWMYARHLKDDPREDILINVCCPNACQTSMTGFTGSKTADEGAEIILYLALLPPNAGTPQGQLLVDNNEEVEWRDKDNYRIFQKPSI
ncbi:carbonyl reductase [NADPH] 1-like isoform X2 [Ptychodera flava]|uniref:carbonyl reductase [NADPH] 1-like isoform X1 n=1 Tax=Ptychodera flava TaxID=63121 RepID=UPI00396AAAA0